MPLLELHQHFSHHAQATITSHTYTVMHRRVAASHSFLACCWLSLTVAASHSFWACGLLSLIVAHLQKQQQSTNASLSIGGVGGVQPLSWCAGDEPRWAAQQFFFDFLALSFPFCLQFATRYPNKMGGGL
jgi:hypothetical protein